MNVGLPSTWMSPAERLNDVGIEQGDPLVRGDVAGPLLLDLAVARAVEQRRHPELESRPVVTNASASRSRETKLGFG